MAAAVTALEAEVGRGATSAAATEETEAAEEVLLVERVTCDGCDSVLAGDAVAVWTCAKCFGYPAADLVVACRWH